MWSYKKWDCKDWKREREPEIKVENVVPRARTALKIPGTTGSDDPYMDSKPGLKSFKGVNVGSGIFQRIWVSNCTMAYKATILQKVNSGGDW